jgi:hypothetical protein
MSANASRQVMSLSSATADVDKTKFLNGQDNEGRHCAAGVEY